MNAEQKGEVERYWNSDFDLMAALVSEKKRTEIYEQFSRVMRPDPMRPGRPIPTPEAFGRLISEAIARVPMLIYESVRTPIFEIICVKWQYCKRRSELSAEGAQLAIGVADALLMANLSLPVPVTALAVYLIKKGLLDELCMCPKG